MSKRAYIQVTYGNINISQANFSFSMWKLQLSWDSIFFKENLCKQWTWNILPKYRRCIALKLVKVKHIKQQQNKLFDKEMPESEKHKLIFTSFLIFHTWMPLAERRKWKNNQLNRILWFIFWIKRLVKKEET